MSDTPRTDAYYKKVAEQVHPTRWPCQADINLARQLERDVSELADTLRLLHDFQNGCPLPKYEREWNKAMADAERLLIKLGK